MAKSSNIQIPEPALSKFLFSDTRMGWFWLLVRVYVGWQWFLAGSEKLQSPLWIGPKSGVAVKGFLMGSLSKTGGAHPDVAGWYGWLIQNIAIPNVGVVSHLVAYGETAIGIALIFGLFTGIAAFFGAFMNMNYLFAGTISINPLLFILELFLVLAWRVAGWLGLDRFFLPVFGTPWSPGSLFRK